MVVCKLDGIAQMLTEIPDLLDILKLQCELCENAEDFWMGNM